MITREQLASLTKLERQLLITLAEKPDYDDPTIAGLQLRTLCNNLGIKEEENTINLFLGLGLLAVIPQEANSPGLDDRCFYILTDRLVLASRMCHLPDGVNLPQHLSTEPGIKGNGFALIRYLWPDKTASLQTIADEVWGDDLTKADAIRKTVDRTNERLEALSEPFCLKFAGGHVRLLWPS